MVFGSPKLQQIHMKLNTKDNTCRVLMRRSGTFTGAHLSKGEGGSWRRGWELVLDEPSYHCPITVANLTSFMSPFLYLSFKLFWSKSQTLNNFILKHFSINVSLRDEDSPFKCTTIPSSPIPQVSKNGLKHKIPRWRSCFSACLINSILLNRLNQDSNKAHGFQVANRALKSL